MKKKILLGLVTTVVVISGVAALSAFEAHIINVTAKIENALSVLPEEIKFGTVFPQEKLDRNLDIRLSESFLEEDRVDDVSYVIKQKPKCINVIGETISGHWECGGEPICPDGYELMPILCSYLSKEPDLNPNNDGPEIVAFHLAHQGDTWGYLSKNAGDIADEWVIDLDVPCFEGMCAQDWTHEGWELPVGLESEVFGCDLWVEVTDFSVNYVDRVDFGNPESEDWHLDMVADDWSYIGSLSCTDPGSCLKIGGYGGYDGGDADFRGLMGPPTGCQATDPSHAAATFKMDVGMGTGTKKLVLRHLDGSQNDSFDVFADGVLIGHYDWHLPGEQWTTTEYDITGYMSIVEFELVATNPDTPWCEQGWGQVMFNWAEIQEVI